MDVRKNLGIIILVYAHHCPKAEEPGLGDISANLVKQVDTHRSRRRPPVSESNAIMLGVPSQIDNNTEHNQRDQSNYFDTGEPEFEFSEHPDTKKVDKENWDRILSERGGSRRGCAHSRG